MAGSLLAQTLSVTITGTLGNVIGGSGYITKPGKYVSGITATGSKGQYCMISYSGGSTAATAKVVLSGTNTIASPTTISLADLVTPGSGYNDASPPVLATASNGTATCTGSSVAVNGVLVDDPLSLSENSFQSTATLNPVGVTYNATSITYSGLTLTLTDFTLGGLTLSCSGATATVAVSTGSGTLNFGSCTFTPTIGTAAFVSTITFPGGTVPAPIPLPFGPVSVVTSPPAASSGTYTLESGSIFNGDATTIAIGPATITATCSGCPTESLTPAGPLSFTPDPCTITPNDAQFNPTRNPPSTGVLSYI